MQITSNEKKDLSNCYMLGTLAIDSTSFPGIGESNEAITVMKNSTNIVFYIKPLSDEPVPISDYINPYIPSEPLYIGIDSHQNQAVFPIEYKFIVDTRKKAEILSKKIKNKIILFRPQINFKEGNSVPFKNIEIITIEDDIEFKSDIEFTSIPKVNIENEIFEQKLLNGNDILLEDYNHCMLPPEYILCGEYLYSNFRSWNKHSVNKNIWSCSKEQDKIKRIKFTLNSNETKNKIVCGTDNLIFMENEFLEKVINARFDDFGEYIIVPSHKTEDRVIDIEEACNDEIKFLKDIKDYTIKTQLCYSIKDLVNFHVSIKTNPLTIVAGMSGTGKTQLAMAYARVLGLSEEDGNFLFIPISPSYTEPEDLLGYLNTTNGLYISSETGLVDFLIKAEKNPDKMFMVIFDEMNLSQVEHWFAPFISLLELHPEERRLKLYSKNSVCHNSEKIKQSIKIGNNIKFIGTVNLDETTKDFSDRLLDRANIVTLKKQTFASHKNEQEKRVDTYKSSFYSYELYSKWIKKKDDIASIFTDEEVKFLDELHEIIQKYDEQKGVSFRIFEKIANYLINIPEDPNGIYSISRKDAFDIQIKQRLLTKIRGTERQFGGLIGVKRENSGIPYNSELYNFFDNEIAQNISHFESTKREIIRKSKELSLYGYAN